MATAIASANIQTVSSNYDEKKEAAKSSGKFQIVSVHENEKKAAILPQIDKTSRVYIEKRLQLVELLGCVCDKYVLHNSEIELTKLEITPFHLNDPPKISIKDYIRRLVKYTNCSNEALLISIIYIDRFVSSNLLDVNAYTIHQLFLSALRLATKFYDDEIGSFCDNKMFCQIGGVNLKKLNCLESEFYFAMKCDLFIFQEQYLEYFNSFTSSKYHVDCSCKPFTNFLDFYKDFPNLYALLPGFENNREKLPSLTKPSELPQSNSEKLPSVAKLPKHPK